MHLFYKKKLYKYLILNNTNFYFFLYEDKIRFVRVMIKICTIIYTIPLLSDLS